jgi:hypothetical protein
MNPDDLARILDELGQRLGPTGEYVFALAVRQVVIDAVLLLAFAAILVGSATYAWRAVARADSFDAAPLRLIAGALYLAATIAAAGALSALLNPEYAALRDILGAIR